MQLRLTLSWLCFIPAVVAACSSGSNDASSSMPPPNYCKTYGASCGSSGSDIQKCQDKCDGKDPSTSSTCWFRACGAMTGKCDKAEPGDKTIVLCAVDHHWFDACEKLRPICQDCADSAGCVDVVAKGDGRACAEFQMASCP